MKTVGIIGFGSFGQFLAEKLSAQCKVLVHARRPVPAKWRATLDEVAAADYIIPSISLEAYETVLNRLKPLIKPDTVIVDICSVKEQPVRLLREILPNNPVVATHPLFGPESAKTTLRGHTLVVCPDGSDPDALRTVQAFAEKLGLSVVRLSMREHDQEMATVHGLTFFIARCLKDLRLHNQTLTTPSFQKLLSLAELEKHHSSELFYTIQNGNPATQKVRQHFIGIAEELNQQINNHKAE